MLAKIAFIFISLLPLGLMQEETGIVANLSNPIITIFGIARTTTFVPTPLPTYQRPCCGYDWSDIETALNTFSWGSFNTYIATMTSNGVKAVYTFTHVPCFVNGTCSGGTGTCAGGNNCTQDPPTDINTNTTCAYFAGSPSIKDCFFKSYVDAFMRNTCSVASQPGSPLIGACKVQYYELWNELNGNGFWSGSYQDLAQMGHDAIIIIRAFCGDCTILGGSVSAGGDGFNPAGGSSHWDLALLDYLTRLIALGTVPDGGSIHSYCCRTTVAPAAMPETMASVSDPLCPTNTPTISCRTAVNNQVTTLKSSTVLCNAAISASMCPGGIPKQNWNTEGGYGLNAQIGDMLNGSMSGSGTVVTFTSTMALPANWTTGTFVTVQDSTVAAWNTASGSHVTITKTGANTFTFANVTTGTSSAGLAQQVTSTNGITPESDFLRQAYASRWYLVLAQQKANVISWYGSDEVCWGTTHISSSTHSACPKDPTMPTGYQPLNTALVQMQTWLSNSSNLAASSTVTAVTGGNLYEVPITYFGASAKIVYFDGWLGTYTYTTAFTHKQDINGTITVPAGSTVLNNTPAIVYN